MKVLTCAPGQFDEASQQCDLLVWTELSDSPSLLPPLTVADGSAIGGAIVGVWAIAFCIRMMRNTVALR